MRNISFSKTIPQFKARTKTVTRRIGWEFLRPGDLLMAIEKGQGLKKGGKVVKLGPIRILKAFRTPLSLIDQQDVIREGFPDMSPDEFVAFFCKAMRCQPDKIVTRIRFEYVETV